MGERRIEYVPLREIERAPRNPKSHDAQAIKASVDRFGLAEVPLVDERTGRLVAGHGRIDDLTTRKGAGESAPDGVRVDDETGDWLVPVIRGWESTSDEDAEAYLVASNHLTVRGGWDEDGLADLLSDLRDTDAALLAVTGFTDADLDALLAADEPDDDDLPTRKERDRAATAPRNPISAEGDLWALGPHHRLLCGDATNPDHLARLLGEFEERPTLVHTDPPYGISAVKKSREIGGGGLVTNRPGNYVIPSSDYDPVIGDDTTDTAAAAHTLLLAELPEARHVWWGANHYTASAMLPDSPCWLVWDKQTNGDFADCELAWTNSGRAVRRLVHLWNGMARASEKAAKRIHPTQKPVALVEWVFEQLDKDNARRLVLDVFAGSGSTLVAAEGTGRVAALMELSPAYVDAICRRFQALTGVKPERLVGDLREPVDFAPDDDETDDE